MLGRPDRRGASAERARGPLKDLERALLRVGSVRQLRDEIQEGGQHRDRRLVVVDGRPVLLAADGNRPQHAREQLAGRGTGPPRVEVEIVAVGAENSGERVSGVADIDLDPVQTTLEKAAEEIDPTHLPGELVRRPSGRELELDQRLLLARDQMVIVVAGQEHEPLALELLANQVKQAVGGAECIPQRREQEVEHVTEEDHLVDVEMWLEKRDRVGLAEDVLASPGAEMRVRQNQRTHLRVAPCGLTDL